jgi:POT family proton-dependent oligopeptide transporter
MGHPKGLAFLAMTEAWERFSFYGMRGLLILFMVQELLLPGRIEHVAGMAAYRSALEALLGPMETQAFASQTFGLYAGLVYFTPMFGGLIADRWLGAKKTVSIGIALMTAGHFAMVFDWSFLLALLLLILGSGCLKGNIAAQVGHLYPRDDEARRTRGYAIFSTGINIGAVLGPVVCGLLAQLYGWHVGFGLAGGMMLIAGLVYLAGLSHFADDRPVGGHAASPPLDAHDWRLIVLLNFILLLSIFQWLAYDQIANAGMIWISEHVDMATPLGQVPVAWFAALDSLASIVCVPFLIGLWRWQAARGAEPGDIGKLAIGAAITGASTLVLAAGAWSAGGGKIALAYPVLGWVLGGIAFMWSWPTLLAMVSRRAPAKINALMMATVYLTGFVSGVGSGYLARYYATMPGWQFWTMHTLVSLGGTVIFVMLGPWLKRRLEAPGAARLASAELALEG